MQEILIIILLSVLPYAELRGGIPYGIIVGINPLLTVVISIFFNILAGVLIYYFIKYIIPVLRKIDLFDKVYSWYEKKVFNKFEKQAEKFGTHAVMIFIAVPLPGSGAYTGALIANLINMGFRNFFKALTTGLIISGVIVTLLIMGGSSAVGLL